MFETAELGRKLTKDEYRELVPELRTKLLQLQRQVEGADFPVVILVGGVDGSGRGDAVNLLNEWMDARGIATVAFDEPTEEERHRPPYWRYWMALPPKGQIGLLTSAWYTAPVVNRAYGRTDDSELDASLQRINAFEKTMVEEGALLIKLWLHISKKRQRQRLKKLESDPRTRWRVGERDWKHARLYDDIRRVCERTLRTTSTGEAPWFVIDSANRRYRDVTLAQQIAERLEQRLQKKSKSVEPRPLEPIEDPETILDTLDLTAKLEKEEYETRLEELQAKLNGLSQKVRDKNVGVTLVFEGSDASGKGGAIRRIIAALDARDYRVIPVSAPTDEELAHHYLWRFWRHLPRLGRFTLYDRSWYGRVLVERVEGLARPNQWMRAYKEITDFEEQLVDHGIVLVKYWLHISGDEQMRRFEERERTPWKQHKITKEDYRNREKANLYEAAANDMIERTSTEYAPWKLVPAEDKRFARVTVLETLCTRLRAALDSA